MSPRSKEQFEELRAKSLEKIHKASLEVFGTKGYAAASIAAIAKKAGVSKGLIYNYYDSKEELLKGMIMDLMSEGEKMIEEANSDNPREMLERIIRSIFTWFRENDKLNRLLINLSLHADQFPFIHDMGVVKMKEYVTMLEGMLKAMGFSDYKTEARILATIFDGIGMQYIVLGKDYPLDEVEQMLLNKYCK